MKNKILLFVIILASTLCFQCTKELDFTDSSKQVVIAYAILNPFEPVQYFKIYKGFITTENAFDLARDPQNIYYHVDSIDVKLIEYDGDKVTRTITLDTTTSIPKNDGTFANPTQILYYTNTAINTMREYELVITLASGKVMKSRIPVCQNFRFTNLMDGSKVSMNARETTLEFTQSVNASGYDIYQLFYYIEVDKQSGEIVKRGSIKRKLNSLMLTNTNLTTYSGRIQFKYAGVGIYNVIANNLERNDAVTRYRYGYQCVGFEVYSAGDDLVTYINVNTPSTSIASDRNLFTNFESEDNSCYGIFSSKNYVSGVWDMSTASEDSLIYGSVTRDLGFDFWRNYPDRDNFIY